MAKGSKRQFAVFDIDGTLVRWQLYHALADALAAKDLISPAGYEEMRSARRAWKSRSTTSFKDYERKVIDVYEKVLLSLTFEQLDGAVDDVFNEYKDQVYTYTRDLIAKLKKDGYLLFAISGSQTEIIAKIANHYGFDDFLGTTYERADGKFSGSVTHFLGKKDVALKKLVKKHGADWTGSVAVGDGGSDVQMLELVEQPIAFNPELTLFEHAQKNGWKIVIERKNMIYELEPSSGKYQLVKTNAG